MQAVNGPEPGFAPSGPAALLPPAAPEGEQGWQAKGGQQERAWLGDHSHLEPRDGRAESGAQSALW